MIEKDISPSLSGRRFKPYPSYKDPGVEWLGKIPIHWGTDRLKYLVNVINERSYDSESDLPFIGLEHIEPGSGRLLTSTEDRIGEIEEIESSSSHFRPGDILFGKLRPYLAKVLKPDFEGRSSTELIVLRCGGNIDPKNLSYQLLSSGFISWINSMTYGTKMPRANAEQIVNTKVPLAPLPEQHAIARFLDRETAKIDALIAKKERLIELLQEKRTALITQAVTKGLDPNVPMKDSGVEWLNEIPAHWETVRMKFLLAAPLKYGANEAAELDDPELPRYVRITDIDENDGLREATFKSLTFEVAKEYLLCEEDLLFARSGATAGKSFLYRRSWGACAYAGYLIRARLDTKKAFPEFIRYFTASTSYWQWIASTLIQATIQNVSAERYANLSLPLPTVAEQRAISAFLARETAKIDSLMAKVKEAIDSLREFRTALISAAVTGKIDVRVMQSTT